jgi:hypothetical protein
LFEILVFPFCRHIPKQVFDTMGIFYLIPLNKLIESYPFTLSLIAMFFGKWQLKVYPHPRRCMPN